MARRCSAAGTSHTLLLSFVDDNEARNVFLAGQQSCEGVVVLGRAANGRLGRADADGGARGEQRVPLRVAQDSDGKALGHLRTVVAGARHSFFLDDDGICYACGAGHDGALGLGTTDDAHAASRLYAFEGLRVADVSAGKDHSLFVIEGTGELWSCGQALDGKLGHADLENFDVAGGGVAVDCVEAIPRQVHFRLRGIRVLRVAAGERHSLCTTAEGELYTFGYGEDGQLGHGPDRAMQMQPRIVAYVQHRLFITDVAAGARHSMALSRDGEVLTFGQGEGGRLGLGDEADSPLPLPVALRMPPPPPRLVQGRVRWDPHVMDEPPRGHVEYGDDAAENDGGEAGDCGHEGFSEVKIESERATVIDAGCRHSVVVCANGALFTFGSGSQGQLGHGDSRHRLTPTFVTHLRGQCVVHASAGSAHTVALVRMNVQASTPASNGERPAVPQTQCIVPVAFGFGLHGQTGRARLDMAPQSRRDCAAEGIWRDGEPQLGSLVPTLRPMNTLLPRRCDNDTDMQEELDVNSPGLISRVSRPQQVSLYDHEFGKGGNGRWYPGQTSHGNKGADLKTWTAEWHKQRKGIYGADALVKAEAKIKMRKEAAAKVRSELERERVRELERRGSFVG